MKTVWLSGVALLATLAVPASAFAQFGGFKSMMPGGGLIPGPRASSAAAVDPDRFLKDTLETTKFVMTAAAILSDAASASPNSASLAAKVKAINGIQDVKELDAHRGDMESDIAALAANKELTARVQANLDAANAEQRQRVAAAAFNFSLGALRNVRLAQEAPHVLDSVKANPILLMRFGEMKTAVELIFIEAKGTAGMAGSIHTLMTAAKISEPVQAEATKPKTIEL